MLAGERAAGREHEVGGPVDEFAVFADSVFTLKVEADAHVDASVPEMSVESGLVVEIVQQRAQIADVWAQLFGRDCGIVPAVPLRCSAWRKRGGSRPCLANLSHCSRFRLGVK